MLERIQTFIKQNSQEIFAIVGILSLSIAGLVAIFQFLRFLSSLPGFRFDPLLALLIVIIVVQLRGYYKEHRNTLKAQTYLLQSLATRLEESKSQPSQKTTPKRKKR